MKRRFDWRGLALFAVAAAVIALDQYTKALVRENLTPYVSWNPIKWLEPYVTLTYVKNTGAAFGLFPNMGALFIVVAVVVVALIVVYYRRLAESSWLLKVAFGLQLGGAIGNNLIDRLFRGYVTDFVDVRIWPIWNVADASIVVGTALLAYYAIFGDRKAQAKEASEASANSPADSTPSA